MIFFGHLGLTTGVFKGYEKIAGKEKNLKSDQRAAIDYRVVLIGAILPDIIDKPIGAFLFRNEFHNSRIFAHSLLFSASLILIGLYRTYRLKKNNVLILGISSFIHQLLDSMWLYPGIFYWPAYGWKFPTRPGGHWLLEDIIRLFTNPYVFMPEIIGFIILAYYFIKLKQKGELKEFFIKGKL